MLKRSRLRRGHGRVSAQADPAPPGIGDEGPERGVLWKLRRVYDWDGRMAERERQARIAAETDMSAERWQEYRRNWNRLLERAAEKGSTSSTSRRHLRTIACSSCPFPLARSLRILANRSGPHLDGMLGPWGTGIRLSIVSATTTGTSRNPGGAAQGRGRAGTGGAHRPSSRILQAAVRPRSAGARGEVPRHGM